MRLHPSAAAMIVAQEVGPPSVLTSPFGSGEMNPSLYTVESLQLSLLAPHYCISKVSGDQGLKDLAETGVLAAIVEPTVISVVHEEEVKVTECLYSVESWIA